MTGKQPDQAPAQPGYWPNRLLTGHVHSHDGISASPASLFAYHQWILRQIRPNRSNQKGGYNDLPPNLDRAMSRHLLDLLYYRLESSRATLRPCPGGPGVSLAERFEPGEYSADFSSQVEKLGLPVESVEHATDNWVALESTEIGWVGHASRPELAWFAGDG